MVKKGFSFVEVVIVVTIIILLAVVAVSMNTKYKQGSENTKITSDIGSVKNALSLYLEEKKLLPDPGGNKSYYDSASNYMESGSGAFGVHGYITETTLPNSYINYLPIDPRTNQYYGYGKTLDESAFEIAGVSQLNLDYIAIVDGNYSGENGPINLIREYNGPDFIYDGSSENFPYNPEERVLTASITSYSGSVSINDSITDYDALLSYTLRAGDTIKVDTGGYANIYFSDGSNSTLGDASVVSELNLSQMTYIEENNLVTKIQLALSIGSLWTQAADMNEGSEFEVFTTDTTAAVRGTDFGVQSDGAKSNITVKQGKVKVGKLSGITDYMNLKTKLKNGETIESSIIDMPGVTTLANENGEQVSYLEGDVGYEKGVDISANGNTQQQIEQTNKKDEISNNLRVEVVSIKNATGTNGLEIKLSISERLKKAEKIMLTSGDNFEDRYSSSLTVSEYLDGDIITINNSTLFAKLEKDGTIVNTPRSIPSHELKNFKIHLCKAEQCTRGIEIFLSNSLDIAQSEETLEYYDQLDPCPLSFPNPKTGKCFENDYAQIGYALVGLTDYTHEELGGKIFGKGGQIILSPLANIKDNYEQDTDGKTLGVKVKANHPIKYNFEPLHLGDNYIIELRVDGESLNLTGAQYLLRTVGSVSNFFKYFKESITSPRRLVIYQKDYAIPTVTTFTNRMYDIVLGVNNTPGVPGIEGSHFMLIKTVGENKVILFNPSGNGVALNPFTDVFIGGAYSATNSTHWRGLIGGLKIYRKLPPEKTGITKSYIKTIPGIDRPPQVNAGVDIQVIYGATNVSINGNFYDPDGGTHTIAWSKVSTLPGGDISPTNALSTNISNLGIGIYDYRLSVTDNTGLIGSDSIKVSVIQNLPPVASVTSSTLSGLTMLLSGQYSSDPEDAGNITYEWSKLSGPTSGGNILNPASIQSGVTTFIEPGFYEYVLRVKDTLGQYNTNTNNKIQITLTQPAASSLNGYGCSSCPFGDWESGDNLDGQRCAPLNPSDANEKYCTGVSSPAYYGHDAPCAREVRRGLSSCEFKYPDSNRSWYGTYTPAMNATINFPI